MMLQKSADSLLQLTGLQRVERAGEGEEQAVGQEAGDADEGRHQR
jgi:hypothetical protein